jgi:hypothetical protein
MKSNLSVINRLGISQLSSAEPRFELRTFGHLSIALWRLQHLTPLEECSFLVLIIKGILNIVI